MVPPLEVSGGGTDFGIFPFSLPCRMLSCHLICAVQAQLVLLMVRQLPLMGKDQQEACKRQQQSVLLSLYFKTENDKCSHFIMLTVSPQKKIKLLLNFIFFPLEFSQHLNSGSTTTETVS